jgi:4-diphosphocytidyl-2-C-methyl-D-erythritol kinase
LTYLFKSYAKINLNLFVGPPLSGGLHPIKSRFQSINVYDTIALTPSSLPKHTVTFSHPDIPDDNTCTKMLLALGARLKQTWAITIHKQVPFGAGLGGGSSNAATLLLALNQLENLQLLLSDQVTLAQTVGSDVPFFLVGGHANVSGVGEVIEPVASRSMHNTVLLIMPKIHLSTPEVYRALDTLGEFDDLPSVDLLDDRRIGENRLLLAANSISPELASLHYALETTLNEPVYMSGSGSTLFMLPPNKHVQTHWLNELNASFSSTVCRECQFVIGTEGRT